MINNTFNILKKELGRWTLMNSFYISLGICLLSIGLYTWFFTDNDIIYDINRVTPAMINAIYWNIALFSPLIATGVIMEEQRNDTFRLLLTKPINISNIVLGKLGAIIIIVLSVFLLSSINYITIYNRVDISFPYLISIYSFLLLLGITYTSISIAVATFFNHYWRSYFVSYLIILFLHYFSNYLVDLSLFEIKDFFTYININSHFEFFKSGGFSLSSYVYLISLSTVGIFIAIYKLSRDN